MSQATNERIVNVCIHLEARSAQKARRLMKTADKVLTIIVPAYNAQQYLGKCLDSFLVPEALPALEVLIIDDGSTDQTREIAVSFEQKYPDTFRVISKENGGHGSGINLGSKEAKGKYFKVIDADDWILSENLPAFLASLSSASSDVVLTNFHEIDMNSGASEPWQMNLPPDLYGKELSFAEFMPHFAEAERVLQFHGITYNTSFYRALQYELTEHVFYEDQEYSTVPFSRAQTILPLDLFVYEYLVGNAAQSVSDANRVKRLWMLEKIIDRLLANMHDASFSALTDVQKDYYTRKLNGLIIDYYMISCILDPDKQNGRNAAKAFHDKIKAASPRLSANTNKQYSVFMLANLSRLKSETYQKMIHSELYQSLK